MGWILTAVAIVLLSAVAFFLKRRRNVREAGRIAALIGQLDRAGAEALYRQYVRQAAEHFQPVLLRHHSAGDFELQLDAAARCRDRMNELDGLPHGPDRLADLRQQILDELKPATDKRASSNV